MRLFGSEVERTVQIPDPHCPFADLVAIRAILRFIKDVRPTRVILMGDLFNLSGISRHVQADLMEQYENPVVDGFIQAGWLVGEIHNAAPRAKLRLLWGNHDDWLRQFVKKHPAWRGILDDPLFLLEHKGNCRVASKIKLIQFDDPEEEYNVGRMGFVHGWYVGKYAAAQHLDAYSSSITCGHTHTMQMFTATRRGQPVAGYTIGHLMSKEGRRYLKGRPTRWVTGFAYMEHDPKTGIFTQHPIPIVDGKFIFAGKIYDGGWKDGTPMRGHAALPDPDGRGRG